MKPKSSLRHFLALAGSSLLAVSSASAADLFWSANGTSQGGASTWDTSTARWGSVAAGPYGTTWDNITNASDTAVFGSTAGAVALGTPITAGGLTFNTTGYSITGSTLTLTGTPVINTATGVAATISSNISGTNGLTRTGGTTSLTLSGNNDYTGITTVSAGTIIVGSNTALGSTAVGSHTTIATAGSNNNRRVGVNSGITTAENFTITGTTESSGYSSPIYAVSGTATLSGTITLAGSGAIRLGGGINFTGTITQSTTSHRLLLAGTNTVSNAMTINGGDLSIVNGTTTLNAVNGTGIGNTDIYADTGSSLLILGVTNAIRTDGNFAFIGNQTTRLNLNGNNQTIRGLTSAAAVTTREVYNSVGSSTSTLTVGNGGGDYSFAGVIRNNTGTGGTVAFTKIGTGTQTLTGINIYTGATTINSGTLAVDFTARANVSGNQTNHIASTSALQLGGGTLSITGVTNGAINTAVAWTGATNSPILNFATLPVGMVVGQPVTGTGIPASAYVVSIDTAGKKITISANASATSGGFTTAATTPTTSQTFANTTLAANTASSVVVDANSGGGTVLNLNAITRNAGATVNFTLPSGTQSATNGITTSTTNTNGLLGNGLGWATVGGTDFATNSTNASGGNIIAYAAYTDVTRQSSGTKVIADGSTSNVRILEGTGSVADITLGAGTATINTLNQSASGAATIDPNGQTLAVNSILVGTGAGSLTIGNGTNNGTLKSAGTELLVIGNAATTINSVIADGTAASTLVKAGAATLTLSGANTYTGGTFDTTGFQNTINGNFSITQSGSNLDLIYTAIPEPGAALLGGLGILMLLRRRR